MKLSTFRKMGQTKRFWYMANIFGHPVVSNPLNLLDLMAELDLMPSLICDSKKRWLVNTNLDHISLIPPFKEEPVFTNPEDAIFWKTLEINLNRRWLDEKN